MHTLNHLCAAVKRFYIIRFIDDPVGLLTPALKLHVGRSAYSQELFDSKAEALKVASTDPLAKNPYRLFATVIEVYI